MIKFFLKIVVRLICISMATLQLCACVSTVRVPLKKVARPSVKKIELVVNHDIKAQHNSIMSTQVSLQNSVASSFHGDLLASLIGASIASVTSVIVEDTSNKGKLEFSNKLLKQLSPIVKSYDFAGKIKSDVLMQIKNVPWLKVVRSSITHYPFNKIILKNPKYVNALLSFSTNYRFMPKYDGLYIFTDAKLYYYDSRSTSDKKLVYKNTFIYFFRFGDEYGKNKMAVQALANNKGALFKRILSKGIYFTAKMFAWDINDSNSYDEYSASSDVKKTYFIDNQNVKREGYILSRDGNYYMLRLDDGSLVTITKNSVLNS